MGATTIDAVIAALNDIVDKAVIEEDPVGYFAALYLKVTQRVKDKIAQGYFDDNPRMERLDVVFANRYLEAYHNYKQGQPTTQSWELAFNATTAQKVIVLQHLLAGMNAHINLDLGVAAATITTPVNIADLQGDFNKINEVLGELLEEVEQSLARIWPGLLWILQKTRKVDDFLINFSMTLARDGAWEFANEYVVLEAEERRLALLQRDERIANFGKKLLRPGRIERFVFWIIRLSERGPVSQKIRDLLD